MKEKIDLNLNIIGWLEGLGDISKMVEKNPREIHILLGYCSSAKFIIKNLKDKIK